MESKGAEDLLETFFVSSKPNEQVVATHIEEWQLLLETAAKQRLSGDESLSFKIIELIAIRIAVCQSLSSTNVVDTECYEKLTRILTVTCSSRNFIRSLEEAVVSLSKKLENHEIFGKQLEFLYQFCSDVVQKMPFLGKDVLLNLICVCIGVTASTPSINLTSPNLLAQFATLQSSLQQISKAFEEEKKVKSKEFSEQQREQLLHSLEPPEDFREIPIIPTLYELINEKDPFIRPNKVIGPYRNSQHYLDVQFRLLREDFVRPLRRFVQDFVKNKDEFIRSNGKTKSTRGQDNNGVRLYNGITFRSAENARQGSKPEYLFNLPQELVKKVKWDKSKRLLPGCLVMMTNDYCRNAIFAVTLLPPFDSNQKGGGDNRRQELANGILRLSIEEGWPMDDDKPYLMFECEAFFEAYRYNLGILQSTRFLREKEQSRRLHEFPFFRNDDNLDELNSLTRFIVKASSDVGLPTYMANKEVELKIQGNNRIDYLKVNPSQPETWPSDLIQTRMKLNSDQYHALKTVLTSELAIIQGPPGTGKTYVGLQIVKTLLFNKKNTEAIPNSPFLVLCYTNHALDQFLELLVQQMPSLNVVRVGGQSKSEILQDHTLAQHRKRLQFQLRERDPINPPPWFLRDPKRKEGAAYAKMKQVENLLQKLASEIAELSCPTGIFRFDRMEIGKRLKRILPFPLWDTMKDPIWLGVRRENFLIPNFRAADVVTQLFVVKPKPLIQNSHKIFVERNTHLNEDKKIDGQVGQGVNEKHEECEYDMDELLEQRVDELGDATWKTRNNTEEKNNSTQNCYFDSCSFNRCKDFTERLNTELERLYMHYNSFNETLSKNTEGNTVSWDLIYLEFITKINNLWAFKTEYQNRADLFYMIFRLFEEERLALPNVNNVFRRAEDGNEFLIQSYNVIRYPIRLKWGIYFKVVEIALELAIDYRDEVTEVLEVLKEEYEEAKHELDVRILSNSDVIGMTTTGAAKMHKLLERARPEIVIVEEAAEILEAHIVTALTEDCKQLILIGDHLQLRPSANVYELEKKYKLNVSLFERMILNGVSLCTLKIQHRMHPEISNLIIGPIYEELHDHSSVHEYPKVKGVKKNLFFITHHELEDTDDDLLSKSNQHEVDFILGLCEYLLHQGYQHGQITILTTYTGQMFLLKKQLPARCRGVRVTSVDNFQGEENDIILLSLVRSNDDDKVGFVGIDNRICVALSRARHGLFVIGNMDGMKNASDTWNQIHKKLKERDNIGEALELMCEHHGKITAVKNGNDFRPLLHGGCDQICDAMLDCGHLCAQFCHTDDVNHEMYVCMKRCEKVCNDNHQCEGICTEECPPCMVPVLKTLPCGHQDRIACCQDINEVICNVLVTKHFDCQYKHQQDLFCHLTDDAHCGVPVEKILPSCGHVRMVECGISLDDVECDVEDERKLACGHWRMLYCHQSIDDIQCDVMDEKSLSCGHKRKMKCSQTADGVRCEVKEEKELPCGHTKKIKCCVSVTDVVCNAIVPVTTEGCSHVQNLPCSKSVNRKCKEKCELTLPCGHECPQECHANEDPDHVQYICSQKCERSCDAGHTCKHNHKCFLKCLPCEVRVNVTLGCGHTVATECRKNNEEYKCTEKIKRTLPCGHEQFVLCHVQPDKHVCTFQVIECKNECTEGHTCSFSHACHEGCPPCEKKVEKTLKCGHSAEICCHDDGNSHKCEEVVREDRNPFCGHRQKKECWMLAAHDDDDFVADDETIFSCSEKVYIMCERCYDEDFVECGDRDGNTCYSCRTAQTRLLNLIDSSNRYGRRRRREEDDYSMFDF